MTPSKLSDTEKHNVIRLYREPGETTSTLAERYGVSSTTIRRILKSNLPQKEYEILTNQKQTARWLEVEQRPSPDLDPAAASSTTQETAIQKELSLQQPLPASPSRRLRKRSSATPTLASDQTEDSVSGANLTTNASTGPGLEGKVLPGESETSNNFDPIQVRSTNGPTEGLKEFLEGELNEELDGGLDEFNDEDLEDDLEPLSPDVPDEKVVYAGSQVHPEVLVNVLPLSMASIPKTCYLVVDRSGELIARPLREFGDLGQIPPQEVQERTLPIFDNHRVARRFSNRSQRVIKIPDGGMLQKACSQLYAKGITRLLINGRVYSL